MYHQDMNASLSPQQLELVRSWAAQGVDLNGIQKLLAQECGVQMTYMDVRFLLLDHGIEILRPAASQPAAEETTPAPEQEKVQEPGGSSVKVKLDDLQIPGTLLSGSAEFASGARGAWQIDNAGRFGWRSLDGKPGPEEMQDFQVELTRILRGM